MGQAPLVSASVVSKAVEDIEAGRRAVVGIGVGHMVEAGHTLASHKAFAIHTSTEEAIDSTLDAHREEATLDNPQGIVDMVGKDGNIRLHQDPTSSKHSIQTVQARLQEPLFVPPSQPSPAPFIT